MANTDVPPPVYGWDNWLAHDHADPNRSQVENKGKPPGVTPLRLAGHPANGDDDQPEFDCIPKSAIDKQKRSAMASAKAKAGPAPPAQKGHKRRARSSANFATATDNVDIGQASTARVQHPPSKKRREEEYYDSDDEHDETGSDDGSDIYPPPAPQQRSCTHIPPHHPPFHLQQQPHPKQRAPGFVPCDGRFPPLRPKCMPMPNPHSMMPPIPRTFQAALQARWNDPMLSNMRNQPPIPPAPAIRDTIEARAAFRRAYLNTNLPGHTIHQPPRPPFPPYFNYMNRHDGPSSVLPRGPLRGPKNYMPRGMPMGMMPRGMPHIPRNMGKDMHVNPSMPRHMPKDIGAPSAPQRQQQHQPYSFDSLRGSGSLNWLQGADALSQQAAMHLQLLLGTAGSGNDFIQKREKDRAPVKGRVPEKGPGFAQFGMQHQQMDLSTAQLRERQELQTFLKQYQQQQQVIEQQKHQERDQQQQEFVQLQQEQQQQLFKQQNRQRGQQQEDLEEEEEQQLFIDAQGILSNFEQRSRSNSNSKLTKTKNGKDKQQKRQRGDVIDDVIEEEEEQQQQSDEYEERAALRRSIREARNSGKHGSSSVSNGTIRPTTNIYANASVSGTSPTDLCCSRGCCQPTMGESLYCELHGAVAVNASKEVLCRSRGCSRKPVGKSPHCDLHKPSPVTSKVSNLRCSTPECYQPPAENSSYCENHGGGSRSQISGTPSVKFNRCAYKKGCDKPATNKSWYCQSHFAEDTKYKKCEYQKKHGGCSEPQMENSKFCELHMKSEANPSHNKCAHNRCYFNARADSIYCGQHEVVEMCTKLNCKEAGASSTASVAM